MLIQLHKQLGIVQGSSNMKAVVLVKRGEVALQTVPIPEPRDPDHVVVRIFAAALNRRDYFITQNLYPGIEVGKISGADGCGVVIKVGSSKHAAWQGKEARITVAISPSVIFNPTFHWGNDEETNSVQMRILGNPYDGTLAEYMSIPADRLALKPQHLSYQQAAALPLAGVTAYRAVVVQGQVRPNQKVLVTGIGGGVSPFAVQFVIAHGAQAFVTSSQDKKIEWAISKLGAKGGANYSTDGWESQLRKAAGGMFDLIIDSAAGDNFEKLQRILRPGGRIVSYGGTTLSKPVVDIYRLFLTQQKIIGSSMGSDADWTKMLECVAKNKIVPVISSVRPLSQAVEAIAEMGGSQASQLGKIVIDIASPESKL